MTDEGIPKWGTLSVWAGEEEYIAGGSTQVPVVHSVAFGYEDTADLIADLDQALAATGQV